MSTHEFKKILGLVSWIQELFESVTEELFQPFFVPNIKYCVPCPGRTLSAVSMGLSVDLASSYKHLLWKAAHFPEPAVYFPAKPFNIEY